MRFPLPPLKGGALRGSPVWTSPAGTAASPLASPERGGASVGGGGVASLFEEQHASGMLLGIRRLIDEVARCYAYCITGMRKALPEVCGYLANADEQFYLRCGEILW